MHVWLQKFPWLSQEIVFKLRLDTGCPGWPGSKAWPGEETKRTKKRTKKLPGEGWGYVLTGLVCAVGFRVLMLCRLGVLLVCLVVVVVVVADEFVRFR